MFAMASAAGLSQLLAEPFNFVQAAKETMLLYEVDGLHRQISQMDGNFPERSNFQAHLGYSVDRGEALPAPQISDILTRN